ncbi:MAG: hypothetical protein CMG46_08100 [Candidatus Marinimicrobia bacterium]|nr:hypothetical protein [Candidatus Neomarinimicrobiota bacterium]
MRRSLKTTTARLSFSNIAWAKESDELYLRLLSDLGVEGVEIAASLVWTEPTKSTVLQRRNYRNFISSFGLQISGLASLLFSRPDLELFSSGVRQQAIIDYLRSTIDLCWDLGGRYLVFGRPQNRQRKGLPLSQANQMAEAVFSVVGAHAADRGCVIGIEPSPTPECDFITTLAEAYNLVSKISSPGVRLHFDTGAAEGANDHHLKSDVLNTLLKGASSCQINDYSLRPPGTNEGNLHSIWAESLASTKYSDWLAIEMQALAKYPLSEQISKSVKFTRQAYQKVLTPQD